MSDTPESRDELAALLSAAADRTLDAAGEERLAGLLNSDPVARAEYYDHVMLAALLRREGRRAAARSGDAEGMVGASRCPTAHGVCLLLLGSGLGCWCWRHRCC